MDVKGNKVYYEKHHILPESLFPNWKKRKSNLVLLTAREHFFCHKLLIKIYPDSHEMKAALWLMCKGNKLQKRKYSSRDYEFARIQFSKIQIQPLPHRPINMEILWYASTKLSIR